MLCFLVGEAHTRQGAFFRLSYGSSLWGELGWSAGAGLVRCCSLRVASVEEEGSETEDGCWAGRANGEVLERGRGSVAEGKRRAGLGEDIWTRGVGVERWEEGEGEEEAVGG